MSESINQEHCKHCKNVLQGAYCSYCGTPKQLQRINGTYILEEIGSVLNFNKGILFTIRELLLRPGKSVNTFIKSDRKRLIKPILFIIICSLVYTLTQQYFEFEDGYIGYSFNEQSTLTTISNWITQHYGYTNILIAFNVALWIKIFFRKTIYNFFEILIMLCFVMGTSMLIFSFFGALGTLFPFEIVDKGFLVGTFYVAWGIGQIFDKRKFVNYIKAYFCYMLGILSLSFIVLLFNTLINLVIA